MFRREFNLMALMALILPPAAHAATNHRIEMFSANPNNPAQANVFAPALLHIAPGDSVTFLPSDPSHNTASKKGMVPEGAEPWNSPVDQEFTVTLTVPGVYGYICVPHYEMGMVGLIVVGDGTANLKAAQKVRHAGKAKAAFAALFKELAA
jgi:pseudoazurin